MGIVEGCKSVLTDCKGSSNLQLETNYNFSEDDVEYDEKGEPILFNTKLERMIYKLKILKNKAIQFKDKESVKHIKWYFINNLYLRIMNSLHHRDLHDPINRLKVMDKEALEIMGAYSMQHKYSEQINDAKKVVKAEKLKNIRKTPKYQKFIGLFKK